MQLLIPLASLLGIETEVLLARLRRNAATWVSIGAFGVIGVVFLLLAVHAGLAMTVGPIWAALIIASTALVIAALIYLIAHLREARARRGAAERRVATESTSLVTTALITALPLLLKSSQLKAFALPLAGVAAAAFFLLRPGRRGSADTD